MATTYPVTRWKVGSATITRVVEIEGPSPGTFLFTEATPERLLQHAWLQPHFLTPDGRTLGAIHAFVIESAGKVVVVDTCVGNDKPRQMKAWHMRQGRFLEDLAEAGYPRERVDTVLCTHLHVDHVGWNTMLVGGHWVPTFPRARYLFARAEWEHWSGEPEGPDREVRNDSVRPVIDAGLADLVEPGHQVTPEVTLVPTPGHTPGHVSVRISSGGEEAIITGDLMHHPVQCSEPDWASRFDVDPVAARNTRRDFLAQHADKPVLVLGTHFATPTAGRVVKSGDAWLFDTTPPAPVREGPELMFFLPSVIVAICGAIGTAGRDSWWGIVPAIPALGFLGFALAMAASRKDYDNVKRQYPKYTRNEHVLTHVLLYFLLPGLVWSFLGLPALVHWFLR